MPRFRRSMLGLAIVVSKGDRWTNRVSHELGRLFRVGSQLG